MAEPRGNVFSVWVEDGRKSGNRRVVYSGPELDRLRRMARAAGGRDANAPPSPGDEARIAAAQNRVVKRGAAVHTTIALNRPEQIETRAANPFTTKSDGIVQFTDGQQLGVDNRANHWRFARRQLDLVTPHPSRDSDVRDWYRASCAALLARSQLHADHFDQAVRSFPDDPQLLLFAGSFHESLSAASVQAFLRSAVPPRGVVLRVGSTRTELGRALFAGDTAEVLGQLDDARVAYERAAELFPRAQAPLLALSQLAMRAGDSTRAANAITNVVSARQEPELEDDPFWTYYGAAGRDADTLLAQAYRSLFADPVR
jgi:hypothetical protein